MPVSPSPAPSPSPAAAIVAPATNVAQDLVELLHVRDAYKGLVAKAIEVGILLLAYLVVRLLVHRVMTRTTDAVARREDLAGRQGRAARLRTLAHLVRGVILWTLAFVFFIAVLSSLGVNVAGIVGTASVAGIAFGLGAQKLVKDAVTGFFILLEDQYVVGDYVTIGSVTGIVEELGTRTTRIRDDEGKIYFLSNGDIGQVCNHSRGTLSGSIEIGIAPQVEPERAIQRLTEGLAARANDLELPQAPVINGIANVEGAKTTLKVQFVAREGQRPGLVAPRVREAARDILVKADIPLA